MPLVQWSSCSTILMESSKYPQLLKGQCLLYLPLGSTIKILTFITIVCSCILYDSHDEQQLSFYTAATDWSLQYQNSVFFMKVELKH